MIGARRLFQDRGRDWTCIYSEDSNYWIATLAGDGCVAMRIVAESWIDLTTELKALDLAKSRMDAVAVCDPLPPMQIVDNIK